MCGIIDNINSLKTSVVLNAAAYSAMLWRLPVVMLMNGHVANNE